MKRFAFAHWSGDLKQGQGTINSESGVLKNINYSFMKRFGDAKGTNPEELVASAHASCFAMAVSAELEKISLRADSIDVQSVISLEKSAESWSIPSVHLIVRAKVPGAPKDKVEAAAQSAKINCPISKLLKANITMDFQLTSDDSVPLQ